MSDDGLMDLESDTPVPEPVEQAPAPVVEAASVHEDDPEVVEVAGQRVVPVSVVKELRDKVRQLTEKAGKADQLEAWQRENEPALRFLQNNRDLLVQRAEPAPAPPPPQADPDAHEAALLMDFYKPDGTPDIDKGARWLALQDRRSGRLADERVQPILARTQQEQSNVNYHMARNIKDANGEMPSDESLRAVWQNMPPELTSNQQVAGMLAALALGMDRMRTPRKAVVPPPANPPLVTESAGGNPRTRPQMSAFEERIARERGVSATKWAENTAGYQPGRATALED
jgi:hypothetical protein